jgi:two-component system, NarL family, invasion response regulator UvrY
MEAMTKAASSKALRVLVTEDHASTRLGIRAILKAAFPRLRLGEAGDEAETLALLKREAWDVHILDISLPGRSGVEVLAEVKRCRPQLPVLVYSAHREEDFAWPMLKAGAAGYLTKERAPEELCQAVECILRGGTYLSPTLSRRLLKPRPASPARHAFADLSPREFQVMRLITVGKSGKAVASELGLSEKTVSTYRMRIFQKLGVGSTAELVRLAVRHRLV